MNIHSLHYQIEAQIMNAIQGCVDYILETEAEDFDANPSETHVYYQALIVEHGIEEARSVLRKAVQDLEKENES